MDSPAQPASPQIVAPAAGGRADAPRLDASSSDRAGDAPGDIFPRGRRERRLCATASRPDWAYLAGLVVLDGAAMTVGSLHALKYASVPALRFVGPVAIGLTWGATLGGAWLALPKCSPEWVGESPREGRVHDDAPLALSLALLAGATAPIVHAIVAGYEGGTGGGSAPTPSSTFEREMHVVAAAVAGFGGALLPYLAPPRTWAAARDLERIRFAADGRGGVFVGYAARF